MNGSFLTERVIIHLNTHMVDVALVRKVDPVTYKPTVYITSPGKEDFKLVEYELMQESKQLDMTDLLKSGVTKKLNEYFTKIMGFDHIRDQFLLEIFKE